MHVNQPPTFVASLRAGVLFHSSARSVHTDFRKKTVVHLATLDAT